MMSGTESLTLQSSGLVGRTNIAPEINRKAHVVVMAMKGKDRSCGSIGQGPGGHQEEVILVWTSDRW